MTNALALLLEFLSLSVLRPIGTILQTRLSYKYTIIEIIMYKYNVIIDKVKIHTRQQKQIDEI